MNVVAVVPVMLVVEMDGECSVRREDCELDFLGRIFLPTSKVVFISAGLHNCVGNVACTNKVLLRLCDVGLAGLVVYKEVHAKYFTALSLAGDVAYREQSR